MKLKALQVGPIGTNCYYLLDEKTNKAAIIDPEDAPKAATYNFYCTGILADGRELPKITLKVGVGSTLPKVKLKATTLNLNTQLTGTEVASTSVTVTGAAGYELAGFEADDLIGTISRRCEAEDWDCVIVTGDRDSLQLIDDHVSVKLVVSRMGQTSAADSVLVSQDLLANYGVRQKRVG